LWLVWSDYQYKGTAGEVENPDQGIIQELKHATDDAEYGRVYAEWISRHMRCALFNVQRVDLTVR
jgi:hypothetical protein